MFIKQIANVNGPYGLLISGDQSFDLESVTAKGNSQTDSATNWKKRQLSEMIDIYALADTEIF